MFKRDSFSASLRKRLKSITNPFRVGCCRTFVWKREGFAPRIPGAPAGALQKRKMTLLCFSFFAEYNHSSMLGDRTQQKTDEQPLIHFSLLRRERDSNPRYAKRTTVFETAPIDHSGISPGLCDAKLFRFAGAKLHQFLHIANFFGEKFLASGFLSYFCHL